MEFCEISNIPPIFRRTLSHFLFVLLYDPKVVQDVLLWVLWRCHSIPQ